MGHGNFSRRFDNLEEANSAKAALDEQIQRSDINNPLNPEWPEQRVKSGQQGRRVYLYYWGFSLENWKELDVIWGAVHRILKSRKADTSRTSEAKKEAG